MNYTQRDIIIVLKLNFGNFFYPIYVVHNYILVNDIFGEF